MFQKPAFGANTSGFGTFSSAASTSSPFGFKPAASTSAFGAAPAFGAAAPAQPAGTGGLFGASTNTTGGLFGNTAATPAPAFGAQTSSFGSSFGSTPAAGGGLFGANNNTTGGLFGGTQNNSAFGAKPAGFGFGATTTNNTSGGGLFGSTAAPSGGLFGAQNNTIGGGGLFGGTATTGFGQQQQATGTGHVKYNPVTGTDVVVKNNSSQNVNIKHLCITCMKEYENKCLEELRLEDYVAGRKGPSQSSFGGFQPTENKPLFGNTGGFGQTATTSAPSVFGGGGLGTNTFGQTNTFAFGGNTQANTQTTSLFGANKPAFGATSTAGQGLFGTTTTTQAPAFGANTSSFGFGANANQQQTGGLFGPKPGVSGATTSGFGSSFGFAAKPAAPAPAFGSTPLGGFGTATSNSGGGLFGGGGFGKTNTTQPAFGMGQTPALGSALGSVNNPLQNKPAGFGALGGGMFQQPQNNNAFSTGLNTGLGGGLFSNQSTLGGGLNMGGMNTNTGMMNSAPGTTNNAVHEQILTAVARPYSGSTLFKDLLPDTSTTAEDVLKPTNPAAMKAALDKSQYKLTSPAQTLKLKPRAHCDKKSLFDGLEEADASLEDKLSLKPSRKRLVLRPNNSYNRENSDPHDIRSLEEHRDSINSPSERDRDTQQNAVEKDRNSGDKDERKPFAENNHFDSSADRHGSWLSSPPPQQWNKDKSNDIEQTPRIYPQLDKELPNQGSERRASWLTTKPLRPPQAPVDSCSVRELRTDVREVDSQYSIEKSLEGDRTGLSLSEEEHVPAVSSSSPAPVTLTRPGYYTIPSLVDMNNYIRPDGRCVLPNLTIGRKNYGNVYFDSQVDVTGMDFDKLVHFLNKEVIIYPEDAEKPPVGEGLNKRAIITLDRIWPRDKTDKTTITSPDRLLKMDYEGKLRRVCDKHDTKFIEYRPQTGSWVFRVEHFSKYGLTDSDEDDDITPEVMKRQIAHQQLQKAAPIPPIPQPPTTGLGGFSTLPTNMVQSPTLGLINDDVMLGSSLNVLNGSKGFDMDTTENADLQSMYDMERAFAVKSPTTELARLENRHSHNVQLMKASLYNDTEMDDVTSQSSSHDQLVPAICRVATPILQQTNIEDVMDVVDKLVQEELEMPMKPLILQPATVVLKYHRKVPPFKNTVAGRLDAKFLADLQLCRSRHSRVGFGPGSSLAYVTSYDSVAELPKSAELCDIGNYLEGRNENDWSNQVVNMIKISNTDVQETLTKHIEALLDCSTSTMRENHSPLFTVENRLELLKKNVEISGESKVDAKFGVSSSYCHEVWKLCDALWGADLENGGVPGTDEQSIVNGYRQFINWITAAVSGVTDKELAEAKTAEIEDDADFHSSRIFTLLVGGRAVEACKLAAERGDLNMCALIAQGGADPNFRSLLARQLSNWTDCGATTVISQHRIATLQLLCGATPPCVRHCHWLAGLSATARYLCPQIPTLEQIVSKYCGILGLSIDNLTEVDEDSNTQYPYPEHYEAHVDGENSSRRITDLRFELIRSKALNCRPKLQPASYTPDPLDYSLCFLLGAWFNHLSFDACASFASQLEANGAWHLAVAVLSYIPEDRVRSHLIRGVVSRNAPAQVSSTLQQQQMRLLNRLGVPPRWLAMAQAERAKYERLPLIEAQHLISAQQWGAAHNVLMKELFADAVLSDNLTPLVPLLESLSEAASRSLVPRWEAGGKALYHYTVLRNEIQGVVQGAESSTPAEEINAKIQSLRPLVIAACASLANLKTTSLRDIAAATEMCCSSRVCGSTTILRGVPHEALLPFPQQMVSELCDRAAEMCVESNTDNLLKSRA